VHFLVEVRKKMSEIMRKLREKAEQTPDYISVGEIPNEIEAKILQQPEFKVDKRGNECLFIRLITKDKKAVVQKYTPTTYKQLMNRIEECGGIEALVKQYHIWKKERSGRAINERLFPVANKK
jgi:hypothetical protein